MTATLPEWITDHSVDQSITVALSPLWEARLLDCTHLVWVLGFANMATAALFVSGEQLHHKAHFVSHHQRFDLPVIVVIQKR